MKYTITIIWSTASPRYKEGVKAYNDQNITPQSLFLPGRDADSFLWQTQNLCASNSPAPPWIVEHWNRYKRNIYKCSTLANITSNIHDTSIIIHHIRSQIQLL